MNRIFNGSSIDASAIVRSLCHATELVAVALNGRSRAGFVCAQIHDSFCYHAPYAEITEVFVKAEFRRTRIATRLVGFMERQLARRGVVHLHVLTASRNKPARTLYEKLGYRRAKPEALYEKDMPLRPARRNSSFRRRRSYLKVT
jgi:ribosomal protein S18 acetylase RimI-like enzyme